MEYKKKRTGIVPMCLIIYLMSLCQKMAHSVTFLVSVFVLENLFFSIRLDRRSALITRPAIQWWVRILVMLVVLCSESSAGSDWWTNDSESNTANWYFNFQRNRCMFWFWFGFSLWFWIVHISTKRAERKLYAWISCELVDCESNHAFRIKINQHKQPQQKTVKTAGLPISVDNQAHIQCLAIGNISQNWALILYASFDAIIISREAIPEIQ